MIEADPRTASNSALISRALARQHRHLRAALTLLDLQAGELGRAHGASVPILRMLATSISASVDAVRRADLCQRPVSRTRREAGSLLR